MRFFTEVRDARLGILSKLSSVEWASVVAKSDLSGDLDPHGVRFLCKNRRENFVEVYDFSGIPELGGLRFLFRKFVELSTALFPTRL